MLLAIDAGNTNIVFALLEDGVIRARWRIATDPRRTADQYAVWLHQLIELEGLPRDVVDAVIIGTVVPRATHNLRASSQGHPDPDHDGVVRAFEQDPRELGAVDEQVVRPFDGDDVAGRISGDDLVQSDRGNERQRRRAWIGGREADEGARMEVAGRAVPFPPLPSPAPGLALGAEPQAFGRAFPRQRRNIVIGRAGLGYETDQNSAPAAVCEAESR